MTWGAEAKYWPTNMTFGIIIPEMNERVRSYSHPARLLQPGDRECWVCGEHVTGVSRTLRHWDEAFRPLIPAVEDQPAFHEAAKVVQAALEGMLTEHVSDADRARAATEALYQAGALRVGRSRWKRPSIRSARAA